MNSSSWSPYVIVYDPLKVGSIDGTDTRPHDHGIVRAMEASYQPDPNVKSNKDRNVFVSQLNPTTTEKTLTEEFGKFGTVKSCRLVRDIVTGFSKCYAFIEYSSSKYAKLAYRVAHHMVIDDKQIFVDLECGRNMAGWVPRRLGGGLGGRKESGQLRFGGRDRPFKKPIIAKEKPHRNQFRHNEIPYHRRNKY